MKRGIVVAAFDFDGTILKGDSGVEFLRFVRSDFRIVLTALFLLPLLLLYVIRIVSGEFAKQWVMKFLIGGMKEERLYELGQTFYEKKLHKMVRPKAMERIAWHQKEGHACFLVTASMSFWTKAWAEANGFTLVSTRPEIINGKFTGMIDGRNCHGKEKVRRLLEAVGNETIIKSYSYGDSPKGDGEMLKWADEGSFKPFRK